MILVAVLSVATFLPISTLNAASVTSENIIQLVNKERTAQGIDLVAENSLLSSAAQDKLNDMIKNDYFAHTSPEGITPWYWVEKKGYDYKYAGENLAINFSSAEEQHEAWMASSTHRKNILNPTYKEIGVAVTEGQLNGTYSTIVVQLFGTQVHGAIPAPKSEPVTKGSEVENAQPAQVATPAPEKTPVTSNEPASSGCAGIMCYLQKFKDTISIPVKVSEEAAWLMVILILFFSITLNAVMLSKKEEQDPFIAANTVVLLLVLTSVVFWRV